MTFDQVREKAKVKSIESGNINIYISSLPENSAGMELADFFRTCAGKEGINADVIASGSFGYYDIEPLIIIEKNGKPGLIFKNADLKIAKMLIDEYLVKDNPLAGTALCTTGSGKINGIPASDNLPLFSLQKRVALRNCGYIDPENINHYISRGGYSGLARALKMDQINAIEEIKKSGLRGRGGAGYYTSDKLKACLKALEKEKYVVCNAMDSDPKSSNAKLLLTSDPHSFLEGLLICAHTVGASVCVVYADSEFLPARQILDKALSQMRELGLLGNRILDTDFNCEINIKTAKTSAVSGEETAILRSLEGRQAMPNLRPPYPEAKGLNGKPTVIINIETLSNISAIFQNNPEIISGIGTEKSKGTKVITFHGSEKRNFTIEVPFGTSLRSIIEKMEEKAGNDIKAVQLGGPTGSYLNGENLDLGMDYDALKKSGFMIGSGTVELIFNSTCAVEMTKEMMSYLQSQSCGKCVFCREGTLQISEMLKDISEGSGKPQDPELINEISEQMKAGCICSFGLTASDPVISAIKLFGNEFDAHIKENRCLKDSK